MREVFEGILKIARAMVTEADGNTLGILDKIEHLVKSLPPMNRVEVLASEAGKGPNINTTLSMRVQKAALASDETLYTPSTEDLGEKDAE